tara:strand:- start:306 stop:683 length:378 start_codon:yes stop_codon:yes gene_type:complete
MIRILKLILVFVSLFLIKVNIRSTSLQRVLNRINQPPFFLELLNINSKNTLISFANVMYEKKIFSCLECAIFIKKILFKNKGAKLFIGVSVYEQEFRSHAWLEENNQIVFGQLRKLDNYKKILEI